MAKRTELERQLHDLAFLKEQVAHLQAEQRTAQRFTWLRAGSLRDERKGAERLLEGGAPTARKSAASAPTGVTKPAADLVVELGNNGTVRLVPSGR
jgi:hypothetical protein